MHFKISLGTQSFFDWIHSNYFISQIIVLWLGEASSETSNVFYLQTCHYFFPIMLLLKRMHKRILSGYIVTVWISLCSQTYAVSGTPDIAVTEYLKTSKFRKGSLWFSVSVQPCVESLLGQSSSGPRSQNQDKCTTGLSAFSPLQQA